MFLFSKFWHMHGFCFGNSHFKKWSFKIYSSVNVFGMKVTYWWHYFYIFDLRQGSQFTWSSEPHEGLAACVCKREFLSLRPAQGFLRIGNQTRESPALHSSALSNTVILLEPYCDAITEPGLPVIESGCVEKGLVGQNRGQQLEKFNTDQRHPLSSVLSFSKLKPYFYEHSSLGSCYFNNFKNFKSIRKKMEVQKFFKKL